MSELPTERPRPDVMLVTMPWHRLNRPSLQLGLLHSVLERAGIAVVTATLALDFMELWGAETAGRPEPERLGIADYDAVVREYSNGLGDWIFAVPPFRNPSGADDARYLALLRESRVAEAVIGKAIEMRGLVPRLLALQADEIVAARPRTVGFTTTFSQNVPSLVLAQLLKQRDPSITVILGGANCDGPMGAALHRAFPWIDIVVRGEAEAVLPEVIHDLCAGNPVRPRPGLCYRDGGQSVVVPQSDGRAVVMDELPLPAFDEYFERLARTSFAAELASSVKLLYESARGCWWGEKSHCTFCGLNGTGMAFRSKSPERVVEELTVLTRRHRRLDIQVVDNILDRRYFRGMLPRLRDTKWDLELFYETKANLLRDEVRLLRESGVAHIQPGIESLSTPVLRLMRKGVTALQNVRLLKWCAEYGIRVHWTLLYGFPGEPPDEYARMAALAPALSHLQPPLLGRLVLDRFSPYHARPEEFGIEILGPRAWYPIVYGLDELTLMDLAYSFEYRLLDGRDPETYVTPLRRALEAWRDGWPGSARSLRYRRGPGFLIVHDRRPEIGQADYAFDEREAGLYLACEDGATAEQALARAPGMTNVDAGEVAAFLDELVQLRLAYEENGRYLALALPYNLPEAD